MQKSASPELPQHSYAFDMVSLGHKLVVQPSNHSRLEIITFLPSFLALYYSFIF